MKSIYLLLVFTFLVAICFAAPNKNRDYTSKDSNPLAAWESETKLKRVTRNVIADTSKRWPNNTVCYKFHPSLNSTERSTILLGIDFFTKDIYLKFVENKVRKDCICFVRGAAGSGCTADVGYMGRERNVTMGPGCFKIGLIAHELGHAAGLFHQHSAQDRDSYIKIIEPNIIESLLFSFKKRSQGESTNLGLPYDYDSIMHYAANIASKNGNDTIVTYQNVPIGQRERMSVIDNEKLRRMYPLNPG